ncbi:MAG: methyl-accepting chemotaxis protein [Thermodesulfobacteriota bacterium]
MMSWQKDLRVRWRLAIFVVFMLLLLVGSGIGGLWGMGSANRMLFVMYHEQGLPLEVLMELDGLVQVNLMANAEKVMFEQISWAEGLHRIEQARATLDERWRAAQAQAASTTGQAPWLAAMRPLMKNVDEMAARLITLVQQKDVDTLDHWSDERLYPLGEEFHEKVQALVQENLAGMAEVYEQSQQDYTRSKTAFVAIMALGILISALASVLLIRSIDEPLSRINATMSRIMGGDLTVRLLHDRQDELGVLIQGFNRMAENLSDLVSRIQRSGIQVTSSITELAATAREQEAVGNQHAATSSEIAASTTEIAATASSLMETMRKVADMARGTAKSAAHGHDGLQRIDRTMTRMEESTGTIVEKLSILSEKAANIAGVVKTINKVADQTNLLSLNAAIEAEKAGEYGAGFAVVATEIRRLADQTAVATFDIEQMVQEVQSAVSAGVMGIDKFAEDVRRSVEEIRQIGHQLTEVIYQVQSLEPQVEAVSEGIEAQSLGASQISSAVSQLNEATQQTAESLAQTSATISQLHQAALGLQDCVSQFKVEAGAKHAPLAV